MSDLPAGWRRTTLGEAATWGSGGTPTASDPRYYGGALPWVVIGDLTDGLVRTTRKMLTPAGMAASSAKLVPPHSVLIAMYGSIGKLGLTDRPITTNQAIAFALPSNKVSAKYLFYYLMHEREALINEGKGAAQRNISQTIIKAWPVPLAPTWLQQQIVDVLEDHLSRLDAATGYLSSAQRRCSAYANQVISRELVGGSGSADLAPAQLAPAGTVDGMLSPLPPSWSWRRLGDVASVVGGITKDSKKQEDPGFIEVPYLRVANVQRGRLDLRSISRIRVAPSKLESLRLLPGDVLMNEGGDRDKLARGWVWDGEIEDCIHQNHVFRARVVDGLIHPKLLSWAANSIGAEWASRNGKQSVNLASISLSKIKLMPVPVPPVPAQAEIVGRIEEGLALAARATSAIADQERRSAALRRALLTAAFSGRLTGRSMDAEVVEEIADSQVAS